MCAMPRLLTRDPLMRAPRARDFHPRWCEIPISHLAVPQPGCRKGFRQGVVREGILAPAGRGRGCEKGFARQRIAGILVPRQVAGRDSRRCGCEKGFAHQPSLCGCEKGFSQQRWRAGRPPHPVAAGASPAGGAARRAPATAGRSVRATRYGELSPGATGGRRGAGRYVARGRSVVRLGPTRSRSGLGSAGGTPGATGGRTPGAGHGGQAQVRRYRRSDARYPPRPAGRYKRLAAASSAPALQAGELWRYNPGARSVSPAGATRPLARDGQRNVG